MNLYNIILPTVPRPSELFKFNLTMIPEALYIIYYTTLRTANSHKSTVLHRDTTNYFQYSLFFCFINTNNTNFRCKQSNKNDMDPIKPLKFYQMYT